VPIRYFSRLNGSATGEEAFETFRLKSSDTACERFTEVAYRHVGQSGLRFVAVEAFVHTLEMWVSHVRINLGRGDIAVAEHCLHTTQVGAIHK
jgi:hypothetical protein